MGIRRFLFPLQHLFRFVHQHSGVTRLLILDHAREFHLTASRVHTDFVSFDFDSQDDVQHGVLNFLLHDKISARGNDGGHKCN